MKKVVLILPTYNERDNVDTLIHAIEEVFRKLPGYKLFIYVVDDYSPDKTGEVVKKLDKKFQNITLLQKKKEGLGAAYIYGMARALEKHQPDILIQMDADWSHNPILLPKFIREIEAGADFVIGSRYISGGSIPGNWGFHRKVFSVVGNSIVRYGLGQLNPRDWTSGYRAMKAQVFTQVSRGLKKFSGYTFQIAFLYRAVQAGFQTAEVPIQFIDRVHGKSKIAPLNYIRNVLLFVFHNSTFLKYTIIGLIGFGVQTLVSKLLISINIFAGLSVGIGSFFAITTNFIGNNMWTFAHKKIQGWSKLIRKFFHFLATSIGAVIIQVVVVGAGVILFGNDAWFALMVFAIVFLVIPYNYFIYNRFIWRGT